MDTIAEFYDLETKRLWLKGISYEDREFIVREFSDDEVNRFLFDAEPITTLDAADEIIAFYLAPEPRNQHRWILIRKEDGAKLGTCGFHVWDRERSRCEMGYDLLPEHWSQGYMSEAVRAILDYACTTMQVRRIDAYIYPENSASVRLAERLGFVFRGETKDELFRGKTYPHRIYTLLLP